LTMPVVEDLADLEVVVVEDSLVAGDQQNVLALSLLLSLALITNLSAAPVILFRRTWFGNGQFACLILCLTMTDLVTTMSGLVGGLVLEVGHMSWVGSSQGCAAYYFISSWMLALSHYLIVCLVCLLLVKRAPGVLARLQECRLLLLCLLVLSLLPAVPELAIRSTVRLSPGQSVCILTTSPLTYALYVTFKLSLRHILPATLILLCLLRPRTVVAKRISLILMGPPAVCECGPSGAVLSTPHECPKMARSRPDILRDAEASEMFQSAAEKTKVAPPSTIPAMVEDPVRRIYKRILALTFISTCSLYVLIDLSFQIQSSVSSNYLTSSTDLHMDDLEESNHEANLGTALYILLYTQQILNPLIFLYSEFLAK